jgi:hypothetical protein
MLRLLVHEEMAQLQSPDMNVDGIRSYCRLSSPGVRGASGGVKTVHSWRNDNRTGVNATTA